MAFIFRLLLWWRGDDRNRVHSHTCVNKQCVTQTHLKFNLVLYYVVLIFISITRHHKHTTWSDAKRVRSLFSLSSCFIFSFLSSYFNFAANVDDSTSLSPYFALALLWTIRYSVCFFFSKSHCFRRRTRLFGWLRIYIKCIFSNIQTLSPSPEALISSAMCSYLFRICRVRVRTQCAPVLTQVMFFCFSARYHILCC